MTNQLQPTFLFVGSGKTGSTWIFKALSAHPEVFVPPAKELYFFNHHYDRGHDWYLRFFTPAGRHYKARGELTPGYLYSSLAAKRIARDLPEAKLFACLRNPVDRTLSAYQFKRRNGLARQGLLAAIEQYPEILQRSRYAGPVQRYQNLFGDRFKVFLHDDLKADPAAFARDIYQFIGVDADFHYANAHERVLSATQPRSVWLARTVYYLSRLAHRMGWIGLIGKVRNSALPKGLYRTLPASEKPVLSAAEKEYLIDYFKEDIQNLQSLLNRDLQSWLKL